MEEVSEDTKDPDILPSELMRDRIIFYASIFLIILGALYLALGSWLHDLLHVPIIGEAYYVFGPINVLFAIVGLILFGLGALLLAYSLKGGTLTPEEVEAVAAGGESR